MTSRQKAEQLFQKLEINPSLVTEQRVLWVAEELESEYDSGFQNGYNQGRTDAEEEG